MHRVLGGHARGRRPDHRLPAGARRPADDALPGEVDLRRARSSPGAGPRPRRDAARAGARAIRRPVHLNTTAETISWEGEGEDRVVVLHTDRGELRSRTVIVAGGHGAFEPKKLPGYRHDARGRAAARTTSSARSRCSHGKRVMIVGGGDSACDWVVNLLDTASEISLVHRREGFRAHELTVGQVLEAADRGDVALHVPFQIKEVYGDGERRAGAAVPLRGRGPRDRGRGRRDPAPARLQDGARAAEGLGLRGRSRARSSSTR